jgi:beta-galactosidase
MRRALLAAAAVACAHPAAAAATAAAAAGTFEVANDAFLLNGAPHQIMSGSVHYFRVHPSLWADRLARLRAMGLNTITSYIAWNWHLAEDGTSFDFSSPGRNITQFFTLAQAAGLQVLLRPGPYICGEPRGGVERRARGEGGYRTLHYYF